MLQITDVAPEDSPMKVVQVKSQSEILDQKFKNADVKNLITPMKTEKDVIETVGYEFVGRKLFGDDETKEEDDGEEKESKIAKAQVELKEVKSATTGTQTGRAATTTTGTQTGRAAATTTGTQTGSAATARGSPLVVKLDEEGKFVGIEGQFQLDPTTGKPVYDAYANTASIVEIRDLSPPALRGSGAAASPTWAQTTRREIGLSAQQPIRPVAQTQTPFQQSELESLGIRESEDFTQSGAPRA